MRKDVLNITRKATEYVMRTIKETVTRRPTVFLNITDKKTNGTVTVSRGFKGSTTYGLSDVPLTDIR